MISIGCAPHNVCYHIGSFTHCSTPEYSGSSRLNSSANDLEIHNNPFQFKRMIPMKWHSLTLARSGLQRNELGSDL